MNEFQEIQREKKQRDKDLKDKLIKEKEARLWEYVDKVAKKKELEKKEQEEKKKNEEKKKQEEKKKLEEKKKKEEKKKQEGRRQEDNSDALNPGFTEILRNLNKLQEQYSSIQSEIKAIRTDQRLILIKLAKLESGGGVSTSSTSTKKDKGRRNEDNC